MNGDTTLIINTAACFRIFGFLLAIPFGFTLIKLGVRVALSVLLAMTLRTESLIVFPTYYLPLEALLGFTLGLPILFFVHCGNMFGSLFDLGRGQSISQIYDPTTNTSPTPSSLLFQYGIFSLLLASNIITVGVEILALSFNKIPSVDVILDAGVALNLSKLLILGLSSIFSFFIPLALIFFTIEVLFGFLGQAVPKLSLMSDSFQIKSLFGILIIISFLKIEGLSSFSKLCQSSLLSLVNIL